MLQRELPFEIRHTITSELFYQYVGIAEKEFSEELYMSSDELKILLSEGMYVGSHTFSHYWLDSMSRNEQAIEIDKSLKDSNYWQYNDRKINKGKNGEYPSKEYLKIKYYG